MFTSIAIELNVLHDDAVELTFVRPWDTVLKKPIQSSLTFVRLGQGLFKSDYITQSLHNWVMLRLCIVFTTGAHVFAPNIVISITFVDSRRGKS